MSQAYVGHFPVTPGVIDYDAVQAFTEGHCGSLAIALHKATGWPLVLLRMRGTRRRFYNGVHMAVLHPSGDIVDIEGRTPRAEMRERWDAEITQTTPEAFVRACDRGDWMPHPETYVTPSFVEPLLQEIA